MKFKKNLFYLLFIFALIPFATSIDQTEIICGGDSELQILCLGNEELSSGLFKKESEGSFIKTKLLVEELVEGISEKLRVETNTFYAILISIGIFSFLALLIIILVLIDKNKKKDKFNK